MSETKAQDPTDDQLRDGALRFLAVGQPTLREWMELSERDRCAMSYARRLLDLKRLSELGRVIVGGPAAVAEWAAELDGGSNCAQLLCERAAADVAVRMAGREIA